MRLGCAARQLLVATLLRRRAQARKLLAVAAVAVTGALGVGFAAAPASPAPIAITKTCGAEYVHANLSWGEKCLRAGEFCKVGNKEYKRYGFYCPSTRHLRRR
jgi:hypothetical protein